VLEGIDDSARNEYSQRRQHLSNKQMWRSAGRLVAVVALAAMGLMSSRAIQQIWIRNAYAAVVLIAGIYMVRCSLIRLVENIVQTRQPEMQ